MRAGIIATLILILMSFFISFYFYPELPENIASHWNIEGVADGYIEKDIALFIIPILSIALLLLFYVIPRIDPMKQNIKKFIKYYDGFIVVFTGFLLYLQLLIIYWNLNYAFNFIQFLVPAFAVLFFSVGILVKNSKRNWFIGIRTPWTLSSDKIWDKTHKTGGKLFQAVGIIALLGIIFTEYAFCLIIVPVIFVAIYATVYSYVEFKKIKRK